MKLLSFMIIFFDNVSGLNKLVRLKLNFNFSAGKCVKFMDNFSWISTKNFSIAQYQFYQMIHSL